MISQPVLNTIDNLPSKKEISREPYPKHLFLKDKAEQILLYRPMYNPYRININK